MNDRKLDCRDNIPLKHIYRDGFLRLVGVEGV
jgi:hypothetical protein